MKKALLIIVSLTLSLHCLAQNTSASKPVYDAALAKKLGADDYGMKKYIMAFLKEGPTQL
ncbi:MAG: hypothetical protein JWQ57_1578, partial [Mucilaginibacter sp.]|nr:hypothetical protein [Mucilaginibacter sp.]